MEASGTGGPGLEPRVRSLETSVDNLHADFKHTQRAIGDLSHQVTSLDAKFNSYGDMLQDVAHKLDDTRTRRPNIGGMVAIAIAAIGLVLSIGALTFAPVYRELTLAQVFHETVAEEFKENAEVFISNSARIGHIENRQKNLENRMLNVESNRFSKQDGQRLEDKIDRLNE